MSHQYSSGFSTDPQLATAVAAASAQVKQQLAQSPATVVVFLTHEYASQWEQLTQLIQQHLETDQIFGCSAEGVAGSRKEVMEGPGISIWATTRQDFRAFRLEFERTSDGMAIVGWPDGLLDDWPEQASMLMLAEPFSFPTDYLLEHLNDSRSGTQIIGGMASGATEPGFNRLFLGTQQFEDGAIVWLLPEDVCVTSLVSQGCRPIGERFVVTAAEQNRILQLGGKPALEQLQRVFMELPTSEQELFQRGLHVGRVVSEYQDRFETGDFLVRNVMGIDDESQSIAVGDYIRPGQTVQFHLRDEQTASAELESMLAKFQQNTTAQSCLMFSCNGRGPRLFRDPDHDANKVADQLGEIPLAGFFAAGELGPVSGRNFVHGFTASLALFQ